MRLKPSAVSRQPSIEVVDQPPAPSPQPRRAFTLVEMLVAMAITLVMMAAVVTLFANVSNSVRNRRATIEMSGVLRHVRNTLQQDLQGATCPGATWQRPDSNHGYIELIEGIQTDQNPTWYMFDDGDGDFSDPGERKAFDPALSIIPRQNIGADLNNDGKITPQELERHYKTPGSLVLGGLGDHDDVLMLTVRNEQEPFVGRSPTGVRPNADEAARFDVDESTTAWDYETVESPLAEVVWFSIENPPDSEDPSNFFGEAGMRTVYRRTLLIAPWLIPYRHTAPNGTVTDTFRTPDGGDFKAEPGLLRMLPDDIDTEQAIAAMVAFQDRYDLSARLEWDHNIQRWKIMANTLADLTKRENRFGHFGFAPAIGARNYPYALISTGAGYSGNSVSVVFVTDPEVGGPTDTAQATGILQDVGAPLLKIVGSYTTAPQNVNNVARQYPVRPFAYVDDDSDRAATAQAMLNEFGEVVRVVHGPVPLWGARRGQDVMITDVLGFDLRVYDPGAPLFQHVATGTILTPSDPGWASAYTSSDNCNTGVSPPAMRIGFKAEEFPYVGQGAYVDLGYGYHYKLPTNTLLPSPAFVSASATYPWFFTPRGLFDVYGNLLAPGYSMYDTWSFHYENNGVNEDGDFRFDSATNSWVPSIDEGTNGFDDPIPNGGGDLLRAGDHVDDVVVSGPDDVGEYETAPPYDKPLRGVQVLIRAYEPDSRAIRQVRVNQHFLPE